MNDKRDIVVGVTGRNLAGKDEVAKFFVQKGFNAYTHSDVLREILAHNGKEATRDAMYRLGNELRSSLGFSALTKKIIDHMVTPAVITGFRHPEEVKECRMRFPKFMLIAVQAPLEVRYKRALSRKRAGEKDVSLETFKMMDERELQGSEEAQQTISVIGMSDVMIVNKGTLEELYTKLEELYKKAIDK